MDKFEEWLINKGYAGKTKSNGIYLYSSMPTGTVNHPTKQMIIGYMIEYICDELERSAYLNLNIICLNTTVNLYRQLEKIIKESKHE